MSASAGTAPEQTTILVVEDDQSTRQSLETLLEAAGLRVIAVPNATTALRAMHQASCDLVVIGFDLPGIDGLALCRLLRAQHATRRLPIIFLAASQEENRNTEAFAAGADDVVLRLSLQRELLPRVRAHIEASQRERELIGSNRELAFLADLGRTLLRELEPFQVARRVAGTTYEALKAVICAAIITDPQKSPAICVFDREGIAVGAESINVERVLALLATNPPAAERILDPARFLLREEAHHIEYVAPLRFNSMALGALIAAYDQTADCDEAESRMIDAAAQQAALAARISAMYQIARESSVALTREVEHRTAEAEAQRRFTQAIIDSLPVSLYAVDRNYRVVAWNRNRELGGQGIAREEVMGRNIFDVLTRQPRHVLETEFARAFQTGEIERIEQETTHLGTTQHWLVSKIPMRAEGDQVSHVITVGEDITRRVEANRAVARTEKLAAVGRLAAGVVHEINNPLATIAACAEALESRAETGVFGSSPDIEDLREYLALIRSEAFRCKMITNGLLDFSRMRPGQPAEIDLGEVLNSAANLLQHQRRGALVNIQVECETNLAYAFGDQGQLQQAVIALGTNGIDAMPEGGSLILRARRGRGPRVLLEVSDTGVGISPENLPKIFDPFFTTKEVGHGTGLGLAVCYGIVTEHGGTITVESAPGRGTTFTLSLPALPRDGDQRIE